MNTLLKALIPIAFLSLHAETNALSLCPSRHFEPTANFGEAFADSRLVTEYEVADKDQDEEHVFQYIEYQTREPGYIPIFSVVLLRSESNTYRVAVVRATDPIANKAQPVASATYRRLPKSLAEPLLSSLSQILRDTHYPAKPCKNFWTDGYVVQAMVSRVPGYGDLVGEAYNPPPESDAGAVVSLGRLLRAYVELKATGRDIALATPEK